MIKARINETGESRYAVDIEVSGHRIHGDEPESSGGKNLGPAPYDLLLASLGECTAMTVRWYAERENWPLEHVAVEMAHEKQGRTDRFTKKVVIKGDALTAEQREKLVEVAGKCPVQRTLMGEPVIETTSA